jgi:hypothetical protein
MSTSFFIKFTCFGKRHIREKFAGIQIERREIFKRQSVNRDSLTAGLVMAQNIHRPAINWDFAAKKYNFRQRKQIKYMGLLDGSKTKQLEYLEQEKSCGNASLALKKVSMS